MHAWLRHCQKGQGAFGILEVSEVYCCMSTKGVRSLPSPKYQLRCTCLRSANKLMVNTLKSACLIDLRPFALLRLR